MMKVSMDIDDLGPVIDITTHEIEKRTGLAGGPEVAVIEVVNEDGKKARFWVFVTMEGDKPVVTVKTMVGFKSVKGKAKGKCVVVDPLVRADFYPLSR